MKFKKVTNIHTLAAITISLIAYYFNPELGRSIFLASLVFNIYLRIFLFSFSRIDTSGQSHNSVLTALLSGSRAALAGLALAVLLLKFDLSLMGVGVAFLLYQVVFIIFSKRKIKLESGICLSS